MAKYDVEYILRLKDLMSRRIRRADADVVKLNHSVNRLRSSLGIVGTELGGVFAVAGAAQLARSSVEVAAKMEALEQSIKFVSGSAEEGKRNLNFLNSEVDRLKLPLLDSANAFKNLIASTKGTSINMGQARELFTAVGQAGRVLQLSSEQLNGTFLAIGQIMSKGKVQAEELRGQLGERLSAAFALASEAMGVTTEEMNKMLEQGQVISDDFIPRFTKVLNEEFAGGVDRATTTLAASLTELDTNVTKLQLGIGRQLAPAVKDLAQGVSVFTEFAKRNKDTILALGKNLLKIGKIYVSLRLGLVAYRTTLVAVNAAQAAMSIGARAAGFAMAIFQGRIRGVIRLLKLSRAAMIATPLGAIATGVALLATEFLDLGAAIDAATSANEKNKKSFQEKRVATALGRARFGNGEGLGGFSITELESAIALGREKLEGLRKIAIPLQVLQPDGTFRPETKQEAAKRAQADFKKANKDLISAITKLTEAATKQRESRGLDANGNLIAGGTTEIKAAAPKIFNLNVDKLVETLTVQTTTLEEGAERVKEIIEEVLVAALADSQKNIR